MEDVVPVQHDVAVFTREVLGSGRLHEHDEVTAALLDPLQPLHVGGDPGVLLTHLVPQVLQRRVTALAERSLRGAEGWSSHRDVVRLHQIFVRPGMGKKKGFGWLFGALSPVNHRGSHQG